jgi:Do/DeqQ family serine protease
VIVTPSGQCLTNHHVVDGAAEISVELSNGRRYDAKLLGSDPPTDLALLRIEGGDFPVLSLGDSDAVQVGDVALAIGNPLGVGQTVTMGIVSAKNRSTGLGEGAFEDFLQTDAPINQGNSGGALVNTAGHLIGINSQIVSVSGGSIGIGFAIPSNMARTVMEQLAKSGQVRRGQLGVGIQPLTPELASSLGIGEREGVLINSVSLGSPAERAGLRRGDVIVAVNGDKLNDPNALRNRIAGTAPGTEVTLTIVRDGKEQQVRARLAEFEAERAQGRGGSQSGDPSSAGKLGLAVQPLSPETAARLGLSVKEGLLVVQVEPGGPAADAGLAEGDILLEANRRSLRSANDLQAALKGSDAVAFLVNRRGQTFFAAIRIPNG